MDKVPNGLSKAAIEARERLQSRLDEDDIKLFRTMAKSCSQQMMYELTGISKSDISHICSMYGLKPPQIRKGGLRNNNSEIIALTKLTIMKNHRAALARLKAKFPSRSA